MSDSPLLGRCWPQLLRAGLPVVTTFGDDLGDDSRPGIVLWAHDISDVRPWAHIAIQAKAHPRMEDWGVWEARHLRVDYRDPAVRDAVVRAVWKAVRGTDPEVVGYHFAPGASLQWRAGPSDVLGGFSWDMVTGGGWQIGGRRLMTVRELAAIPADSPDLGILALRAIADAVLGGAA